jgi:hypothetical protein
VVVVLAALALAPWARPVRFHPLPAWQTGASGTLRSSYGPVPGVAAPREATAWIATGVHYRDRPTADPPNATLSQLPPKGIVVFAAVYESASPRGRPIVLQLDRARRYPCCDGTYVPGGEYELDGAGAAGAYSVIVRVYYGSRPTPAMRARAQHAIDQLELPAPR